MKAVDFSYDGQKKVLENISFQIKPGEKIAFVGANGAGKSTLCHLILRLYEPDKGCVFYDGKALPAYNLDAYRMRFGVVFQDHRLFAASLAENVTLDIGADVRRATQALEQAGFKEQLNRMAEGLDTPITREFSDKGTLLSGGETQKVAIARCLYRDAAMLLLDEPSSALDAETEYRLNHEIMRQNSEKTVIFVSHRLSTTRQCDRIYLLDHGRVIECGNHDELMAKKGQYAEMFTIQARRYEKIAAIVGETTPSG